MKRPEAEEAKSAPNRFAQEAILRALLDNSFIAVIIADNKGNYQYANRAAAEIFGYKAEQLMQMNVSELDAIGPASSHAQYEAYRQTGDELGFFQVRRPDGEERTVQYHATQFDDNAHISVMIDVTTQHNALEKLHISEAKYRSLFALAGDAILTVGPPPGAIIDANVAACELLGYTPEELRQVPSSQIVAPAYAEQTRREWLEQLTAKGRFLVETKWIRKDGQEIDVSVSGKPLNTKEQSLFQLIGRDITEQKRAEAALKAALTELEQLKNRLQTENIYLKNEIKIQHNAGELVGQSEAIQHLVTQLELVAQTDASVLIMGETGTGKELIARKLHASSLRCDRPLVKVNCATLPSELIESELFGHEADAFTGAIKRREGRFHLADQGTIFLDEIGELPLHLQSKLLRVLQEGEFERLGSSTTHRVDVRLIAATNRDLQQLAKQGLFREDLFFRLNVFPLYVPPLRKRKDDILPLTQHFITQLNSKLGRRVQHIPPAVLRMLQEYEWPGNIRELANIIERAMIISPEQELICQEWLLKGNKHTTQPDLLPLKDIERQHILKVLTHTSWRVSGKGGAAEILGLKPTTLEARMKRLGIKRPKS